MHAYKLLKFECTHEDVSVAGVNIKRPSGISVKQWMDFWERMCAAMEKEEDGKYSFTPSKVEEYDSED